MEGIRRSPEYYAQQARAAEAAGNWEEASRLWHDARGVTLGHNRAERYYEAAKRCDRKAEETKKK
jgi:hypothetical protein